jgi:hypothetical protein
MQLVQLSKGFAGPVATGGGVWSCLLRDARLVWPDSCMQTMVQSIDPCFGPRKGRRHVVMESYLYRVLLGTVRPKVT